MQNDSKTKQKRQAEAEKKSHPNGADKFFELFLKAARKKS